MRFCLFGLVFKQENCDNARVVPLFLTNKLEGRLDESKCFKEVVNTGLEMRVSLKTQEFKRPK